MIEKLNLIYGLSKYINELSFNDDNLIRIPVQKNTYKLLDLLKDKKHDNKDDYSFFINKKPSGWELEVSSWNVCRHNGSSFYDDSSEHNFTADICEVILVDLKEQYEKIEFKRLEKLEEERRIQKLKDQIVPAEKRFR